ncbi:preprotein translocase subunit YajC [Limnoglobus roseus]|uniref:Sec translocon accessory complex subunit YajC n=1 Tax=Limnoglobus roseus TaxID=2598579 RepID=A0A5C1A8N9_9BACT|nr:preprotein translocase subunit YajC [Limnoglobus roseus]QEL14132.1 preprotein translocase subunit YajC [Limnoglobus roseus]
MPAYILIAQDPAPATDAPTKKQQAGPFGDPMFPMLLMGLAVVFLFILPMRKQKREQQQMLSSVKRGARVVTTSGIIGTVVTVKDNEDEMTIRSEDAKIKVLKSSIARVLGQEESEPAKA